MDSAPWNELVSLLPFLRETM